MNRVKNFKNYDEFQAYIAREYLKKHKVYRYRTVKIDEIDDNKIDNVCHWFCEENNLVQDYVFFLDQELNLQNGKEYLGKTIKVIIDRPLGSNHPQHKELVYPINYGYYEDVYAPDGEPQDVYVLGVYEPISKVKLSLLFIGLTTLKINGLLPLKNSVIQKMILAKRRVFKSSFLIVKSSCK